MFVSVAGEDPEIVYNCPASLMSVFPGEEHGLHSNDRDYEIAVNTYHLYWQNSTLLSRIPAVERGLKIALLKRYGDLRVTSDTA